MTYGNDMRKTVFLSFDNLFHSFGYGPTAVIRDEGCNSTRNETGSGMLWDEGSYSIRDAMGSGMLQY